MFILSGFKVESTNVRKENVHKGSNKHRRPTKRVSYFAQRSQLLFSPKEEATSAYDVENK